MEIILTGVREYAEGYNIKIIDNVYNADERLCIEATNEDGYNRVFIDLEDLLLWIKTNKLELINKPVETTNEQPKTMEERGFGCRNGFDGCDGKVNGRCVCV